MDGVKRTKGKAAACILCVFVGSTTFAKDNGPSDFDQKRSVRTQQRISTDLAPIKSKSDLSNYLARVPVEQSPLRFLSPSARTSFLESLVFTELGLASFHYYELESELTPSQIYQVLGLFGLQETASRFKYARIENQTDAEIIRGGVNTDIDYEGYACQPPATCVRNSQSICIGGNCGKIP